MGRRLGKDGDKVLGIRSIVGGYRIDRGVLGIVCAWPGDCTYLD